MPKITTYLGIILILLGLIAYFATGMVSVTALIPSFFGIVFVVLGVLGRKEKLHKHMMHAAAGLSLLGLIGSAPGLMGVLTLISGGSVERPGASITQAIMAVLLIGFLILAVKSFIAARKAQEV